MAEKKASGTWVFVGALIALLVAVLVSVYFLSSVYNIIPLTYIRFENAVIVAVTVYVIFRVIRSFLEAYLRRYAEKAYIQPIIFFVSIFGYAILGLAVTASLGINVSSLIIGGSLVSVIIGLASQTVLSNQFAGLMITVVRPFKVGDYVTINTWQYGGTFPVLYPKYFSTDRIEASAYSGYVENITINYTSLQLDNGDIVKIPNGVLVQGAILTKKGDMRVKARYEVPKYIIFDLIKGEIVDQVKSIDGIQSLPEVLVEEATLNTYLINVIASFNGNSFDLKKSEMLEIIMKIVEPMKVA